MANTSRLDTILIERGLLPTKQAAQAAIMDGGVIVNGQKITKPGSAVRVDAIVELTAAWQGGKYVSRGGLKLEKALEVFHIDPEEKICLDLGASTGGFTDCLLKNGATCVYAIDVGYGQLNWSLRQDARVIVKERVNARYLTPGELYKDNAQQATIAVADLSFISIVKVLPACFDLLADEGELVALVKPQFEAGRHLIGKGGVVRSKDVHLQVLENTLATAAQLDFAIAALTYSPIKGPAGNIEFLAHWRKQRTAADLNLPAVVDEAHRHLLV